MFLVVFIDGFDIGELNEESSNSETVVEVP
jgi:hypothetical protein